MTIVSLRSRDADVDDAVKNGCCAHLWTCHAILTPFSRRHRRPRRVILSSLMAKIREHHWVPRLRQLVKKIRSKCQGCKRFQTKAFQTPPPGKLPSSRTQGTAPFQVLGVDFAGPVKYHDKGKKEKKSYLGMFACSLTRAVHLELVRSLETEEFIICLKKFIARRGRPELVYSDNGSTFKAAAKWLQKVRKDEMFNDYLAKLEIKWRFNLSRAPWWGGGAIRETDRII